jgi:malonyl-CoA O-methyltransferase
MTERLELMRIAPEMIVEACSVAGAAVPPLQRIFPKAAIVSIGLAAAPLPRSRLGRWLSRPVGRLSQALGRDGAYRLPVLTADPGRLPLRANSVDLLWSVLSLNFTSDIPAVLGEWCRVLRPGGLAMFALLGPDTLRELRAAISEAGEPVRVHGFPDMHDIGDMLIDSGLADPVMEAEWMTLTYQSAAGLVADLREGGRTNALAGRPRGLMTPRRWARVLQAYESQRKEGRLPASFEIVFGHAWRGAPRQLPDGRAIIRFDRALPNAADTRG